MSKTAANTRVGWRGVTLDARTASALEWAEKKSGVHITPTQGSFRPRTPYSGSTHMGSSAADISVRGLTTKQRIRLVHALKLAGFAAWFRTPADGFPYHIHAILIGSGKDGTGPVGGNEMSTGAAYQVRSFDQGRNGLTNNAVDPTYRPKIKRRWSWKQNKPVQRP